jgi:hypothetical protein
MPPITPLEILDGSFFADPEDVGEKTAIVFEED